MGNFLRHRTLCCATELNMVHPSISPLGFQITIDIMGNKWCQRIVEEVNQNSGGVLISFLSEAMLTMDLRQGLLRQSVGAQLLSRTARPVLRDQVTSRTLRSTALPRRPTCRFLASQPPRVLPRTAVPRRERR